MAEDKGGPHATRSPGAEVSEGGERERAPLPCRGSGGVVNALLFLAAIASNLQPLAGEGTVVAGAHAGGSQGVRPGAGALWGARCGQEGGGSLPLAMRLSGGEVPHGGSDGVIFGNLGQDADPELEGVNTQLWQAARRGETSKIEELVRAGAQINGYYATDEGTRDTPLHFAVLGGHCETVRELVRLGADVMAADGCENVALHLAAAAGDLEMVKCLDALECDVRSINMDMKRPLQVAKKYGKKQVYKWLKERESIVAEEEQITAIQDCWREETPSRSGDDESMSEPYGESTKRLLKGVSKLFRKDERQLELPEKDIRPMVDELEDMLYKEYRDLD